MASECQEPLLREASVPTPDGYEPLKKSYTIYSPNGTGSGIQILLDTKWMNVQKLLLVEWTAVKSKT